MTEYKTTNILLAAFLKVEGFKLDRIDMTERKGTFVFENESDLQSRIQSDTNNLTQAVEQFTLGNALVEPNAFNSALRVLTGAAKNLSNY
jgi:hypothetical protein